MDVQTLFFVEASLLFLFSATMAVNSIGQRSQESNYWFAASNCLGAVGLVAHSLRPEASQYYTVVLANFLLYMELTLLNKAVAEFVGHGRRLWIFFTGMSVALTCVTASMVHYGLPHSIVVDCISVATISTSAASATLLYRYMRYGGKASTFVMATMFALYCLHNIFCIVDNVIHPHHRFYHIWIDRTLIAGLSFAYLLMSSARLRSSIEEQANTDPLTGMLNRRAMESAALRLGSRKAPTATVSTLMLDLDDFKIINDTYGHHAGDLALRHLADCLRETMRGSDLIARLGGDEFLVLMPATTEIDARLAAERLQERIGTLRVPCDGHVFSIRASIGVSSFDHEKFHLDDLIRLGDRALYAVKTSKRSLPAPLPVTFVPAELPPLSQAAN